MINKKFIEKLKKNYLKHNKDRSEIITQSNTILHDSKRIIFALHRDEIKKSEESLKELENKILKLNKKYTLVRLEQEGSYNAAIEEFVEAKLFSIVLQGKNIDEFEALKINLTGYIGGLSDLTGELVRKAINEATNNNYEVVSKYKKIITDILAELAEFDMTGYLRNKFDQAKNNLKKIEQIDYEIKIRS